MTRLVSRLKSTVPALKSPLTHRHLPKNPSPNTSQGFSFQPDLFKNSYTINHSNLIVQRVLWMASGVHVTLFLYPSSGLGTTRNRQWRKSISPLLPTAFQSLIISLVLKDAHLSNSTGSLSSWFSDNLTSSSTSYLWTTLVNMLVPCALLLRSAPQFVVYLYEVTLQYLSSRHWFLNPGIRIRLLLSQCAP